MTNVEPKGPYIYQPYGMQDEENWRSGKIYGIGGVGGCTTIKGLTERNANRVLAALVDDPSGWRDIGSAPKD